MDELAAAMCDADAGKGSGCGGRGSGLLGRGPVEEGIDAAVEAADAAHDVGAEEIRRLHLRRARGAELEAAPAASVRHGLSLLRQSPAQTAMWEGLKLQCRFGGQALRVGGILVLGSSSSLAHLWKDAARPTEDCWEGHILGRISRAAASAGLITRCDESLLGALNTSIVLKHESSRTV